MRAIRAAHRLGRALLPVMWVACESPTEQREEALAPARARWQAAGLTDYDFDLRRLCYCLDEAVRPVTVSVRAGAFASIVYADDGTAADTALFHDFLTMDGVFHYVERAVSRRPAVFTATYDSRLGYPEQVQLDGDRQIADDEVSLEVPALRPVTR
ncbi:MAG: DUF6174 domain-containing protein [Acidimicrobiales bacterium]